MRYPNDNVAFRHPVYISVFREDGTVAISHSGIEMGQGINTKVFTISALSTFMKETFQKKDIFTIGGASSSLRVGYPRSHDKSGASNRVDFSKCN